VLLDFGTLLGQIVERALPPEDEKPPLLRITMVSRPGPNEFDVLPSEPREGLMVIDLRATHRPVPSYPEAEQGGPWEPPAPSAVPEKNPPRPTAPLSPCQRPLGAPPGPRSASMVELIVRVPVGAPEHQRKEAVLDVLQRHDLRLSDVGSKCSVEVREVGPERRVGPSLWSQVKGRQGKPSVRWAGMFRGRR